MAAPRLSRISGVWQVGGSAGMAAEVARVRDSYSVSSEGTSHCCALLTVEVRSFLEKGWWQL
jgi:hypothetical protein